MMCCCSVPWCFSKYMRIRLLNVLKFLLGFFDVNRDEARSLGICQQHRDRLGIYWRGRGKNCQIPSEVARHKGKAVKGDRSLDKEMSHYIKDQTGKLIPVGSGKFYIYIYKITLCQKKTNAFTCTCFKKFSRNFTRAPGA